jgi:hypothetical protein
VRRVFASETHRDPSDADAALYDGFIADGDRRQFARIRSSAPAQLRAFAAQHNRPQVNTCGDSRMGATGPFPPIRVAPQCAPTAIPGRIDPTA